MNECLHERPARARGFALVTVLLVIAVLSLIAASMLTSSRVASQLVHYAHERARSGAVAEAGINRAILALLDPQPVRRWRFDGTPYQVSLLGTAVTLRIQDELGKIDLNAADRPLLLGLFSSAGLGPKAADLLVDKILDWRDGGGGGVKRLHGATAEDYRIARYSYHPRGAPFQRVDELLLVMGMTHDLFRRVEPALTVYSGRALIDPQVAPREAQAALAQMDQTQADRMIAARRAADSSIARQDGPPSEGTIEPATSIAGRAYAISVEIANNERTNAVIRLTGDPRQPYWVLAWREK